MTQPPDDAALVARLKASVTYGYMPMAVRRCLCEAATALEAKDRRIAEVEAEVERLKQCLLYLTSCQAATLEGLPAKTSKSARRRFVILAERAAQFVRGVPVDRPQDRESVLKRVDDARRAALEPSDKGVG